MDNQKIDGSILTKNLCLGSIGHVTGFGLGEFNPAPSQQILSALEQRINDEVEPIAEKAMRDLERAVCGELEKMGIKWQHTSLTQFSASIKKQHAARLKDERIEAIVDGLVASPQPTKDAE